jgi:hypothetical protein
MKAAYFRCVFDTQVYPRKKDGPLGASEPEGSVCGWSSCRLEERERRCENGVGEGGIEVASNKERGGDQGRMSWCCKVLDFLSRHLSLGTRAKNAF